MGVLKIPVEDDPGYALTRVKAQSIAFAYANDYRDRLQEPGGGDKWPVVLPICAYRVQWMASLETTACAEAYVGEGYDKRPIR